MKHFHNLKKILSLSVLLTLGSSILVSGEYESVEEALEVLLSSSLSSGRDAMVYLSEHPEESVPLLIDIVENQKDGWLRSSFTLAQTEDERIVPFYINQLRDNFYLKDDDGNRKVFGFGSPHGCCVRTNFYGAHMARTLGRQGDSEAVPVLKEALEEGDDEVQGKALEALYKVGHFSLDDLFDNGKKENRNSRDVAQIILGIGWKKIHSDTHRAVEIFGRVIEEFSDLDRQVASAHSWRIQCFTLLGKYDRALEECDAVEKFSQFENLTKQIPERREEIIRLKSKASEEEAKPTAKDPEN